MAVRLSPQALPTTPQEPEVLLRGWVNKLSYREHAWKRRVLEVTSACELIYYASDDKDSPPRGIISLEDCKLRAPCKYVGTDNQIVPHVLLASAERSASVRHHRWWIKRDYYFAFKTPSELREWKTAIIRAKEMATDASFERVRLSPGVGVLDAKVQDAAENEDEDSQLARAKASATARLASSFSSLVNRLTLRAEPTSGVIYMLGCPYDAAAAGTSISDPRSRKSMSGFARDLHSRLWFTYRRDFRPIIPTACTTDTGWGCMLRSGQMMMAEGLIRHYLGREWRFDPHRPPRKEYVSVLRLFEDDPCAPFSIHKIAQFGMHYGKEIGEWFGPSTVCQVLKFLFETGPIEDVGYVLSDDGVVYRDVVRSACTCKGTGAASWKACVIVIPLRIGVDTLNPEYLPKLAAFLEFPQSIGFVGGRPRSSFYFVASRGATEVYFLDPHTTQDHKPMDKRCETSSFHCEQLKRMAFTELDPSLAVGFYCADEAEFNDLCVRLVDSQPDMYPIIQVQDQRPEYNEAADAGIDEDDWEDGTL